MGSQMIDKRKEYKFVLKNHELENFLFNIRKKISVLYPTRQITSLYYDTYNFQLYKQSRDIDTNKMKVRVRKYGNENNYFKEIKLNDAHGKTKTIEELNISNFDDIKNIFERNMNLKPTVFTSYTRDYYQYEDVRITVDKSISFSNHKSRSLHEKKYFFPDSVVEYKMTNNSPDVEKSFFMNPVAFSKYQEAVSKIFYLHL